MSAKRKPENQINMDNWNDEDDEPQEIGKFEKANEDELKNRVIRVAKRRVRQSENESETAAPRSNVFTGFSLLPSKDSTTTTSSEKPLFSFGGAPFQSQSKPFSFSSTAVKDTTALSAIIKSANFCTKLKELNKAVLDCVKGHVDGGTLCILSPIFNDYIKYVKNLEDEDSKKPLEPVKAPVPTFSFGNTNNNGNSISSIAATTTTTIAKVTVSPTPPSTTSFTFSKPLVGFGSAPAAGTNLFGGAKPLPQEQSTSGTSADKPNDVTENEGNEDEPPKVEFTPVVESESIYSKRCKVFVKSDSDYGNRGTGTLYLKSVQDNKIQLIVRADTNLGNILLNILLTASVPVKRLGKNNVMLICIPTPESDPKPTSVLVRVKTEEEADELLAEIQKHQK